MCVGVKAIISLIYRTNGKKAICKRKQMIPQDLRNALFFAVAQTEKGRNGTHLPYTFFGLE